MNSYEPKFKGENCLVTGGAGFIGSNLSRHLARIGANVKVLDNFSTGRKENVSDFQDLGIVLVDSDISDQNTSAGDIETNLQGSSSSEDTQTDDVGEAEIDETKPKT